MPVNVPDSGDFNALANKVSLLDIAAAQQASQLATQSVQIAADAAAIASLTARVAKLEAAPPPPPDPPPDPPPPPPPPSTDFTLSLIGGWQLTGNIGGYYGWQEGGLAIDYATMRAWTGGHDQRDTIHEYTLPPMGIGTTPSQWPVVNPTKEFPNSLYWSGIAKHGTQSYTPGLMFRDGLLWVSGREFYASDGGNSATIVRRFDVSGATPQLVDTKTFAGRPMQAFGGGFIEGTDMVGCGGYESGQGTRDGPCWMRWDGTIVNEFGPFNEGTPKDQIERREANYISGVSWGTPPDGTTGYFCNERIYDGGVQIGDTTCIWVTCGIGQLAYAKQNETFSDKQQVYLYRYKPGQRYGTFERFETPVGSRDKAPVRGCSVSPDQKRVYLFVQNLTRPNGFDWCPAIFVYDVIPK